MSGFSIYAYGNPTVYVDPDGNVVATATGTAVGTAWGIGQAIGSMIYDATLGNGLRDASDYVDVVAQNSIAGAELGAAVDITVASGGSLGVIAGGGLSNAGLGGLTLDGKAKDWNKFGKDQIDDAALGMLLGPAASKFGKLVTDKSAAVLGKFAEKGAAATSEVLGAGAGNAFQTATQQSSQVLLHAATGGEYGQKELNYGDIGESFVLGSMGGAVAPIHKQFGPKLKPKPLTVAERQRRMSQARSMAEDDLSQPIIRSRTTRELYDGDGELGILPHRGEGFFNRKVIRPKKNLPANIKPTPPPNKLKPAFRYPHGAAKPRVRIDTNTGKYRIRFKESKLNYQ